MYFIIYLASNSSFYWISPVQHSCKNKCGSNYEHWDCSCQASCVRSGTCCENFSIDCPLEFIKEKCVLCVNCVEDGVCTKCKNNATLMDNKCKCVNDAKYNIFFDSCNNLV